MSERPPIDRLQAIMACLRDPHTGCTWDIAQTFVTIAPYTIEEAYEVADAIERGDMEELRDELGDLLLQVVFHARIAEEAGAFDFNAVASAICNKMERRHPHIFGGTSSRPAWEDIKAAERQASEDGSALAGVARSLPALMVAEKLQKRAARTGFDWPDIQGALAKVHEEVIEVANADTHDQREEEIGDLLFSIVNVARHLKIDPEVALRRANTKFSRRFRAMETEAGGAAAFASLTLEEQDALWNRVKAI